MNTSFFDLFWTCLSIMDLSTTTKHRNGSRGIGAAIVRRLAKDEHQ
jgi:hypothetical protein